MALARITGLNFGHNETSIATALSEPWERHIICVPTVRKGFASKCVTTHFAVIAALGTFMPTTPLDNDSRVQPN